MPFVDSQNIRPLESLLLFQSIANNGTDAGTFETAADFLKQCELFEDDGEGGIVGVGQRANAAHLQQVFLSLLKQQAKRELSFQKSSAEEEQRNSRSNGVDNATEDRSKDRASISPRMASLDDARPHFHLIPKIVPQLYEEYREQIVKAIKADEERYDKLSTELEALQQQQQPTSSKSSQVPAGDAPSANGAKLEPQADSLDSTARPTNRASSAPKSPRQAVTSAQNETTDLPAASANAPATADRAKGPSKASATVDNANDISKPTRKLSPSNGTSAATSPSRSVPPPIRETPQPPSKPSPAAPPPSNDRKIQSNSTNAPPPSQVVQDAKSKTAFPPVSPWSPGPSNRPNPLAPPPPSKTATTPSAGSSTHPKAPTEASSNGPSRPFPQPPASLQQAQNIPTPHSPLHPHHNAAAQQQQQQQQHQTPIPPHLRPYAPTHGSPSSRGGVMLQPFQVTPQAPRHAVDTHKHTPVISSSKAITAADQKPFAPSTPQQAAATPPRLTTNVSSSRPQRSDSVNTPGSTTGWKGASRGIMSTAIHSKKEETPRPPSPLSERGTSPEPEAEMERPKKRTKRPKGPTSQQSLTVPTSKPQVGRGGRPRSSMTPSIASNSIRGRTRSQSVSSHMEAVSSTEVVNDSDAEAATPITTTDSTRVAGIKRKRNGSNSVGRAAATSTTAPSTPVAIASARPDKVVAWRNFNRMVVPLMDQIQSHRLAAIFAHPVKAEGYSDLIKRPQDLKSIRAAISAGARAVNAATSAAETSSDSPGVMSSNGSTITLPISEDFVPPKAIVNADQLEQELMRMFANAIMFNPGYEGIIRDTRAMYADVQQAMDQWRTSDIGDDSVGGAGGDDPGRGSGISTRRRL